MMPPQSATVDLSVVARLRKREPAAMAELYDHYGNIVHSLVFRIVGDHHTAEDLVQETFLTVWTRAHLYTLERGAVRVWILSIARNKALDYIRYACSSGTRQINVGGSIHFERFSLPHIRNFLMRTVFFW